MAHQSIKQELLDYIIHRGYRMDKLYGGRKYIKLIPPDSFAPEDWQAPRALYLEGFGQYPIYVGTCGAFRIGRTVDTSRSITDDLRRARFMPDYGLSAQYYRQGRLFTE